MSEEIFDCDYMTVSVDRSPEHDKKVVDRLIAWYKEHKAFTGESIFQQDSCQLDACDFLSDLAEQELGFEIEYKDE